MQRRLVVLDWHVRSYRRPFYQEAAARLAMHGIDMRVIVVAPPAIAAARRDTGLQGDDVEVAVSHFKIGSREISYRHLGHVIGSLRPDLVVTEQSVRNLDLLPMLATRRHKGIRLALWGHGATYGRRHGILLRQYKEWITRRADWFFAYTDAGREWAACHGIDAEKVTVLNNSTDTVSLRRDLRAVTEHRLREFQQEHRLTRGHTALFMGALDRSKRLDLLLEAGERLHGEDPRFVLLVAGAGDQWDEVAHYANERQWLAVIGRVDGHLKSLALRASDFMLMPEGIGLVATDALAAGRPFVTMSGQAHGPEFAYLTDGATALVGVSVTELTRHAMRIMNDPDLRLRMGNKCEVDGRSYSIERMSGRFVDGVLEAVS